MKVKELIEQLQKIDQDEEVIIKSIDGGLNSIGEIRSVKVSLIHTSTLSSYAQYDYEYAVSGYKAFELIGKSKKSL